ncbi:alpha beta-hydrolase [Pisolithus marmoratus]|nr:alpha beta-hydrolase [Pisolithus marmoratus]
MSDFTLPSATQWGLPSSIKRALLVHGGGRVAEALARAGYFVVAPNLIGHGFRAGSDFRMATMAKDLHSYLAHVDYDVIIAHSLGSTVVAALLLSLPRSRSTSLVLVDPSLEFSPEFVKAVKEEWADSVANVKPVEDFMAHFLKWIRLDAITRVVGLQSCASPDIIREILTQNDPWAFGHLLSNCPPNVTIAVLIANPEVEKHVPKHPQITCSTISGVTHWVQYEAPERIVNAALRSVREGQEV